jgi:PilZ domain
MLKAAFIVVTDKAPKLECTVRNISETGAALEVSTTFGIPAQFDVIIDGVRHHCRQVWRTGTKIGVTFS